MTNQAAVEAAEAIEALNRIDKNLPMYGAYETGSQSELDILTVRLFLSAYQSPTDEPKSPFFGKPLEGDFINGFPVDAAPALPVELEGLRQAIENRDKLLRTKKAFGHENQGLYTEGGVILNAAIASAEQLERSKP